MGRSIKTFKRANKLYNCKKRSVYKAYNNVNLIVEKVNDLAITKSVYSFSQSLHFVVESQVMNFDEQFHKNYPKRLLKYTFIIMISRYQDSCNGVGDLY